MPKIKTPKGTYKFKLIPIYPGWKLIDKEKAFDNLREEGGDDRLTIEKSELLRR